MELKQVCSFFFFVEGFLIGEGKENIFRKEFEMYKGISFLTQLLEMYNRKWTDGQAQSISTRVGSIVRYNTASCFLYLYSEASAAEIMAAKNSKPPKPIPRKTLGDINFYSEVVFGAIREMMNENYYDVLNLAVISIMHAVKIKGLNGG
jgi:hypothetical protein